MNNIKQCFTSALIIQTRIINEIKNLKSLKADNINLSNYLLSSTYASQSGQFVQLSSANILGNNFSLSGDLNLSGDLTFNGNKENTSGGIVVLDENGQILSSLLSSNYWTKYEINEKIAKSHNIKIEKLDSLPESVNNYDENTIYLVSQGNENNDIYDEYLIISGQWELIGNTRINMNDYARLDTQNVFSEHISIANNQNHGTFIGKSIITFKNEGAYGGNGSISHDGLSFHSDHNDTSVDITLNTLSGLQIGNNISIHPTSGIVLSGNPQNTSGGIVVLNENGKIPSSSYDGFTQKTISIVKIPSNAAVYLELEYSTDPTFTENVEKISTSGITENDPRFKIFDGFEYVNIPSNGLGTPFDGFPFNITLSGLNPNELTYIRYCWILEDVIEIRGTFNDANNNSIIYNFNPNVNAFLIGEGDETGGTYYLKIQKDADNFILSICEGPNNIDIENYEIVGRGYSDDNFETITWEFNNSSYDIEFISDPNNEIINTIKYISKSDYYSLTYPSFSEGGSVVDQNQFLLVDETAEAAKKLETPRKIQLSGSIIGNSYFDGTENIVIDTSFNANNFSLDLSTIDSVKINWNQINNRPDSIWIFKDKLDYTTDLSGIPNLNNYLPLSTYVEQSGQFVQLSAANTLGNNFSLNGDLKLNGYSLNSPSGLVVLDENGNLKIGNNFQNIQILTNGIKSQSYYNQNIINGIISFNNNIFDHITSELDDTKPIILYFDFNSYSGIQNFESHIRFNGHDQNTSGGIVVLDESGKIPTSSYDIPKESDPIFSANSGQFVQLSSANILGDNFTISGDLKLNGYSLNSPSGLVVLDENGKIPLSRIEVKNSVITQNNYTIDYLSGDIFNISSNSDGSLDIINVPIGEGIFVRINNESGSLIDFNGNTIINDNGIYFISFINITGNPELINIIKKDE